MNTSIALRIVKPEQEELGKIRYIFHKKSQMKKAVDSLQNIGISGHEITILTPYNASYLNERYRNKLGEGIVIGAIFGIVLGIIFSPFWSNSFNSLFSPPLSRISMGVVGAVVGGMLGAPIGALLGEIFPWNRLEKIDNERITGKFLVEVETYSMDLQNQAAQILSLYEGIPQP